MTIGGENLQEQDYIDKYTPEFGQIVSSQIVQTTDDGYVVGGSELVFKLSERGAVEWNTSLNGAVVSYILPSEDQGFLLVGIYYDYDAKSDFHYLWSCKIDDSGVIEWEKSFKTDQGNNGEGNTAIQNGNGGFAIVGHIYDDTNTQHKLWVLNIHGDGTLIDESLLVAQDLPKYDIKEILIPEDRSGYVIAGWVIGAHPTSSNYPILFKMDNNGVLNWEYSMEPLFKDITSIIEDTDGIIFVGSTQIKALVMKFNMKGSLVWENYYGKGERKHWAYSVSKDKDGYILAGFTNAKGAGLDDIWIFKLDEVGNMIWDQTFGNTGYDNATSIISTSDNGYAAAGIIQINDVFVLPNDYNVWIGKMDDKGQIER